MIERNSREQTVGRFAPSPTGALHTGSLVTAVGSYLMAKKSGGEWRLRLDDLDAPRQVTGVADDIMRTLESFGLFWDGPVSRQSGHLDFYASAFEELIKQGEIYPCYCSRKEIARSSSAPHVEDDGIPYNGNCGLGGTKTGAVRSWRVRVPDECVTFTDLRRGLVCQNLSSFTGDFAVKRGDGVFAYQLAVVVDDYLTGVNQVVRGDDLLSSTPRQIYLQRLLGYPEPQYCHLPLVTGQSGAKLSKRDNLISSRLTSVKGHEKELLLKILCFLGQSPPEDLFGFSCAEILSWSSSNFKKVDLALQGGVLAI
ncbi:MAG: tRNA glutamyl-Q(34) synthetase GluQRS [Desulfuromonadaceae bacterium]|nr:tRNA glutamyl-Q(34) synthetase GluQRS [Desulfuromonadaceae bacterium]MDD2854947.1 tRNA glutamyl-Q(34) synthetase GluQRS [Desulfuromonadaceae bacterium]